MEGMGKEGIGRDWDGLLRNDDHGVREMMLEGCKKLADEIESMRRAVDAGEMEPEDGGRGTGERAARIRCLSAYLAEVLDVLDARHDCNMALLSEAEADIEKLGERASNAQVEIASVRGLLSEDGTRPAGIDSGPFKSSLQRLEWQGASMRCEQGLGAARRRLDLLFARCSAWMSQGLAVRPGEEVPGGGVPTDGRGEEQGGMAWLKNGPQRVFCWQRSLLWQ